MRRRRPAVEWLAGVLPRPWFFRVYGRAKAGSWPNLRDPKRLSERLLSRMLDPGPELEQMVRTGDKYTLRGYVEERLGAGYLARLHDVINVGEQVTAERMAAWPERTVVKASHGSNWMAFVDRGSDAPEALDASVQRWLRSSYAKVRGEPHYALMTPRVVVEEDLRRGGLPPADVKFFVFDGTPRIALFESGRFGELRRFVADPEWRPLAVRYAAPPPDQDPPPPRALAQMREIARELAAGLRFVRIDLYEIADRVLVGEMTHFPGAGAPPFVPRSFDDELGAVWAEHRPVGPDWWRDEACSPASGAGRT
jgi:hypothetical protein